uniref:MFS domain-containing protein n=1 Tax=Steinernema glaseri TaxID=37863 RepID=A0A1I7Y9E5_9BILA
MPSHHQRGSLFFSSFANSIASNPIEKDGWLGYTLAQDLAAMSSDSSELKRMCVCGHSTRFGVLVIGALCFSLYMATGIAFYSAMVPMTDLTTSPLFSNDSSVDVDYSSWDLPMADRRFTYSVMEKSWLIGNVFLGLLVGSVPLMAFMNRFGPHPTVILLGTASTVITAFIPLAASLGTPFLAVLRFVQGIGFANIFPIIGSIMTRWAAITESGLFISLLTGYIQLSIIISTPISGVFAKNFGWPSIYYVHAAIAGALTIIWALFFRNDPAKHPFVGDKEIRKISTGKPPMASIKKPTNVPYRAILTSPAIWVVWIACVGNYLATQFSITFFYMYLVWVLKIDGETAGFVAPIPLVTQLILKFVTGLVSDRITFMSERNKCRFFNSLAFYGAAFFFVVLAFVHPEDKMICAFLAMLPQAMIGFNPGGFNKSSVLVARQHSPAVLAVTQVILCMTLFFGSFIVLSMTPNSTFEEYRCVFLLYAVVLVVTNTIFVIFCRAEAAEWTKDKPQQADRVSPSSA